MFSLVRKVKVQEKLPRNDGELTTAIDRAKPSMRTRERNGITVYFGVNTADGYFCVYPVPVLNLLKPTGYVMHQQV